MCPSPVRRMSLKLELEVVSLIRNPLDVAVFSAHFSGCDTSKATKNLLSKTFTIARNEVRAALQLDHVPGTCSHHVRSWTEHRDFPVLVLPL